MKIQQLLLLILIVIFLSMVPATLAKNIQNQVYEQVWRAENPTLMQFEQNHSQPLNSTPVVAAASYMSVWQATHSVLWRIENPTLNESASVLVSSGMSDPEGHKEKAVNRTSSRGFRMYGENPTL